jgi:asparagine synthase (glutamine-hydrolysing)
MVDRSTRVALVFNGEIYNDRELRAELTAKGHQFATRCDTEVLLRGYIQWGERVVSRLVGMFAFVIWDPRTQTVFSARDRLGIKPLYWTQINDALLVASEVKAFFSYPSFVQTPNDWAVASYLMFRQAIGELCFFSGVHKLAPGHTLRVRHGELATTRYWRLPERPVVHANSEDDCLLHVEHLLDQSVRRCLRADVPVAAFLSGGLDSSLLTALMVKHAGSQIRTFSVGHGTSGYDEGGYACAVAAHLGTNHAHVVVDWDKYVSTWPALVAHRDAPLSIPHEVPLFILSRELKANATVVLAGDGADELFGGYGRVMRSPFDWTRILWVRSLLGDRMSASIADRFPESWLRVLRLRTPEEHFLEVYHWFSEKERRHILTSSSDEEGFGEFIRRIIGSIVGPNEHKHHYDAVQSFFQLVHLACLLDKLDAMTMAAGVEGRVPFVDHELVEYVTMLPFEWKLAWRSQFHRAAGIFRSAASLSESLDCTKVMLRSIAAKYLPKEMAQRKKVGFPTPLDDWFVDGFRIFAEDVLLGSACRARGLFNNASVERLLSQGKSLPFGMYGKKIWMLVNVELWMQNIGRQVPDNNVDCEDRVNIV